MKKLSAFLLLGLTVAFASCGDEKTEDDSRWFLAPQAAVGGTTVEMTCQTRFGEGVLDGVGVGFTYAPIVDGKIGPFADSADCRVDGNTLSSTLDGLLPQTFYVVYAFADFPSGRMQSPAASFETGKDELPEPDPDKPAFGTPSASAVTETTATLTCGFTFEGTGYKVYFRYKPSSASGYSQQEVSAGTGTKTAFSDRADRRHELRVPALRRLERADLCQHRGNFHDRAERRRIRRYEVLGVARTCSGGQVEQRLSLRIPYLSRLFDRRSQSA
ncbi:hypothetical protein [Alistipes sp.]|uniref:hypothetical protein n=1 Tax=Alistipes sp. TaxID=1872444 RepID=UPI00307EAAA3